jgi:Leucine-rich repeat (LRR) protein
VFEDKMSYKMGVQCLANGNIEGAIRSLRLAVEKNPYFLDAWRALVDALEKKGDVNAAREARTNLDAIDPSKVLTPEEREAVQQIERATGKTVILVSLKKFKSILPFFEIVKQPVVSIDDGHVSGFGIEKIPLDSFPLDIFARLQHLQALILAGAGLKVIPESFGRLDRLKTLDLHSNQLTSLPTSIGNLVSLTRLELYGNQITSLPESIGNLRSLESLSLSENAINSLPRSIGNLRSVTMLNLNHNKLTLLPDTIGGMISLQNLFLNSNLLTRLPETIGNLTSLMDLAASTNLLTTLPDSIGNLRSLEKLFFMDNRLTDLPDSVRKLKSLKELRLDDNPAPQISKELKKWFKELEKAGCYVELPLDEHGKKRFQKFMDRANERTF